MKTNINADIDIVSKLRARRCDPACREVDGHFAHQLNCLAPLFAAAADEIEAGRRRETRLREIVDWELHWTRPGPARDVLTKVNEQFRYVR